jgi:hypothetical protein
MNHQIKTQTLDITWNGSESQALHYQQRLGDWTYTTLMPAIEQALDVCVPTHTHLYVERLDIDLGDFSLQNFEAISPKKAAETIKQIIREKYALPTANWVQRNPTQRTLEALAYFLQTGLLPWNFRIETGETLEKIVSQLFTNQIDLLIQTINPLLHRPEVRERLSRQFSRLFLFDLLEAITPPFFSDWKSLLEKIENTPLSEREKKATECATWQMIWEAISKNESPNAVGIRVEGKGQRVARQGQQVEGKGQRVKGRGQGERGKKAEENYLKTVNSQPSIINRKESIVKSQSQNTPKEIYLQNAGVVLLHPFLSRFWEGINCVSDDTLIWPEKAALSLHFLATGRAEAPEYELPLAKVFCGVSLEMPLDLSTLWTVQDTEEAEALLGAVIKYWPVLKDSSIDLLRAEFLQRVGKLSHRHDGWLLQVERRDFDFLLEQIPWSFSTIKLPWMTEILFVEWV